MTLLEAISSMINEMTITKYQMVSIKINDDVEGKNLVEARCYPVDKDLKVAIFKLSFDDEINGKVEEP